MTGAVAGELPPCVEYVGVDGCPAGWLVAGIDAPGGWYFAVFETFESLWDRLDRQSCEQVLVDVPVGLRDDGVRVCDERARDLLGCRRSSVFRTPVREAVERKRAEGDGQDLRPDASDVNEERTGYGLSVQVWNIADDIAALDDFFAAHDLPLDGPVREAHPELAFMAFNGQPVAYSKKRDRGRALRRAILDDTAVDVSSVTDEAAATVRGGGVDEDDVLDAMVLALAARTELTTVPTDPAVEQPRIYYPDREPDWNAQSYFSG